MAVRLDGTTSLSGEDQSFPVRLLPNGGITAEKLADDALTGAKIAADSVDSEHYVDGSIDTAHLADEAVTAAKIGSGAATDGYVLTADGSGGTAWEAAAGGGPAYGHDGDPASAAQTVTTSMATITGTTLALPTLSAGDRLQLSYCFEIVANGSTENITFKGRLEGQNVAQPTSKTATGSYYSVVDLVVDAAGENDSFRGYDTSDFGQVSISGLDISGGASLTGAVQSDGTAATVRIRSISYIHYPA